MIFESRWSPVFVCLQCFDELLVFRCCPGRYAARFAERGINSLPELQAMPKDVVRSLGMKVLEERRFLRSRAAIAA